MSSPALCCRNLSCGYHSRAVLSEVDLNLSAGDIVTLLGPNGSGKSTLLKTLGRSIPILGGSVSVQGLNLGKYTDRDLAREIAFVPQEEFSHFGFSVEQVVLMGRMPVSSGLADSKEDLQAAAEAMRLVDCLELRDRSIQEISGGEKQRVWIARALAQGARVILLDEPSAHLDVAHQVALVKLLRQLASNGLAILAAVHDLNLAAALRSRGALLINGRIALAAPIEQVLSDPLLEQAYGVQFDRFQSASGEVRVLPPL